MNSKKHLHWFLIVGFVIFGLTACEISRSGDVVSDIAPLAPPASAQANATLRIEPASQPLDAGGVTTAEIWVTDVTNLAAVDLELRFDPAILNVVDADPGKDGIQIQPGNFLTADFVVKNEANNDSGIVHYTITQVAPTSPVNGGGLLALITFNAMAPGNSPISFSIAQLASGTAQAIAADLQPGEIIVAQGGGQPAPAPATAPPATPLTGLPTPTFTPIPTNVPVQISPTPPPAGVATLSPAQQPVDTSQADTPTPLPPPTATFTPIPPPPATIYQMVYIPPGATYGFCYMAQPGEDIYTLSDKFNTTPYAINLANDLYEPYIIKGPQTIFVPQELGNGPNVYRVKPGDTLAILAERCKIPVEMLAQVNAIDLGEAQQHANTILLTQGGGVTDLIIPIPPFPPPSRYQYPRGPIPIIPYQQPYPIHKDPLYRW